MDLNADLLIDRLYFLEETAALVREVRELTLDDRYFLFYGPMGAGKTHWIREWGEQSGLADPVQSPSYALIHEYAPGSVPGSLPITHMDWFRLESEEEAFEAGIDEAMKTAEGLVFIEWPDRLPRWIPYPHIQIELEIAGDDQRRVRVERRAKKPLA